METAGRASGSHFVAGFRVKVFVAGRPGRIKRKRAHARERQAKIRRAIRGPGELLRVNIAVSPAFLSRRFGVIDDPILGSARRLHKRAMTQAPDLISLLEYGP